MSELILTTCDSGAGNLKAGRIADRVLSFTHRLAEGPIPKACSPERFFIERRALYETEGLFFEDWWFDVEPSEATPRHYRVWSGLPELARQFDHITFWIDPDPNAQLVLLQLLDWLGNLADILPKLKLKQSEQRLGARHAGDWFLPPRPVEPQDVALASRAWNAFRNSTPEAWAALLQDDLSCLPGLRNAVVGMLDELPNHSGLGAGARRIVRLAERQDWWDKVEARGETVTHPLRDEDRRVVALMKRASQTGTRMATGFWQFGQTICDLGFADMPALSGVTEPEFSLDMHQDAARHRTFQHSVVTLTDLGRRVRDDGADWSRHNLIHRWWGGTRLANDVLWRWDAVTQRLGGP